jgi:hypothetical protein
MEAHAGTIGIRTRPREGRTGWLVSLRERARENRRRRARKAHALRISGAATRSVPGSEHTHLLPRSRGY